MENSSNSTVLENCEEQMRSSLPFDFCDPVNVKMQAINPGRPSHVPNSSFVGQMAANEMFEEDMNKSPESNYSMGYGNETDLNSYQLRWNDHIPYLTNILQGLREQNELTDVTFACEDGIVVAHKLVLSSCSTYLRGLFGRLGTPHPVIFLRNTPSSMVRHLMEFIYCGSVDVSEKELVEVVSLGQSMKIQGLEKFNFPKEEASNEKNTSSRISEDGSTTREVRPKSPILPGEIREQPDYSGFNGQGINYDTENNNIEGFKVKKEAKTISPKPSSQQKNHKKSPKSKQNPKRKREVGTLESSSNNTVKKSCNEVVEKDNPPESQTMFVSGKGRLCYTPYIKKVLGKYYLEHGQQKAIKFVKEKFGMDVPDRTMRKWRKYYMDLNKNERCINE